MMRHPLSHADETIGLVEIPPPLESFNRVAPDVRLGRDVKLFGFVNAYGCTIGDRSKIGAFVEIQKGASIDDLERESARCTFWVYKVLATLHSAGQVE